MRKLFVMNVYGEHVERILDIRDGVVRGPEWSWRYNYDQRKKYAVRGLPQMEPGDFLAFLQGPEYSSRRDIPREMNSWDEVDVPMLMMTRMTSVTFDEDENLYTVKFDVVRIVYNTRARDIGRNLTEYARRSAVNWSYPYRVHVGVDLALLD